MELLIIYTTICLFYSAYLMITIYIPVVLELKYIVEERWGLKTVGKVKRFSTFYLFIAWVMAAFFAPYLLYYITKFGHYECLKQYKETLWGDVRVEALEIIKNGENDS